MCQALARGLDAAGAPRAAARPPGVLPVPARPPGQQREPLLQHTDTTSASAVSAARRPAGLGPVKVK